MFARALPSALIYSSLLICLRPSWEILIFCQLHGNESTVTLQLPASGVFFDIFSPRQNCFLSPTPFCFFFLLFLAADAALVYFHVISFHTFFFFFFEGRPISTVVLHPAGSQVCFFFFSFF